MDPVLEKHPFKLALGFGARVRPSAGSGCNLVSRVHGGRAVTKSLRYPIYSRFPESPSTLMSGLSHKRS